MRVDIKGMVVSVDTDLYVAGNLEDGSEYTAERYFVTVIQPNGKRWVHSEVFNGAFRETNRHGISNFVDVRRSAFKAADFLAKRVSGRGYIDTNHWGEGRAVYGSEYYQQTERVW